MTADTTYVPKFYTHNGGDDAVVASGGSLDIESGGAFKIAGVQVTATANEINTGTVAGLTATAAELNKFHLAAIGTHTLVVGTEGGNAINVAIQLKDVAGADMAVRSGLLAYLSNDANGDAIVTTAPSGGWAIGTDGLLIPIVAGKAAYLISESDGDIDITITEAGVYTCYMILVLPNGKLIASGAITFA